MAPWPPLDVTPATRGFPSGGMGRCTKPVARAHFALLGLDSASSLLSSGLNCKYLTLAALVRLKNAYPITLLNNLLSAMNLLCLFFLATVYGSFEVLAVTIGSVSGSDPTRPLY